MKTRKSLAIVMILAVAMVFTMIPATASAASGKTGFSKKPSTEAAKLMQVARSKTGCPYVSGAAGPNRFDCSGYVAYCMHKAGIKLRRGTAASYYKAGYNVGRNISRAQQGDIILYSSGGSIIHCGIYAGNKKVYQATCSRGTALTDYRWTRQSVAAIIRTYTPAGAAKIVQRPTKSGTVVKGWQYSIKGCGITRTATTDSRGQIVVKKLGAGRYTVTNTAAPTGYKKVGVKKIIIRSGSIRTVKCSSILAEAE